MSRFFKWAIAKFQTLDLFLEYVKFCGEHWQDIVGGASVPILAWSIWFYVGNPPTWVNWTVVLMAFVLAGYYSWRVDFLKLIPGFSVTEVIAQPTETEDPTSMNLFVQVVTTCLTAAPVLDCRAHLLRVSKRFSDSEEWKITGMNSPLFLDWDYYGSQALTLYPGVMRRLNVCWWNDKSIFIIPSVTPIPSKFKTIFNSAGTFKFDIRITALECQPVDVSVTVNVDSRIWNMPIISLVMGTG